MYTTYYARRIDVETATAVAFVGRYLLPHSPRFLCPFRRFFLFLAITSSSSSLPSHSGRPSSSPVWADAQVARDGTGSPAGRGHGSFKNIIITFVYIRAREHPNARGSTRSPRQAALPSSKGTDTAADDVDSHRPPPAPPTITRAPLRRSRNRRPDPTVGTRRTSERLKSVPTC